MHLDSTQTDAGSNPAGMALLTVDYAYRLDGPSWPELSGTFYIFGQWGTQSTRDFLLDLFRVRHKDSILIDLNLQNSQP